MLRRRVWMAVVLAAIATLAAGASARGDGQAAERRVVFVTVLDAQGKFVPDLTVANFKAEFRGRPATVVSSTGGTAPRHVAIVVDISGSEIQSPSPQWAKAEQLIEQLERDDTIGLFTVKQTLTKYGGFTADRDVLRAAIRAARAHGFSGSSSIYDGIAEAAASIPDPRPGDAVCLFSDGDDTSSSRTDIEAAQFLAKRNVRVFLFGDVHDLPGRSVIPKGEWASVAKATGGWAVWFDPRTQDPAAAARSSAEIAAAIASGYLLEVDLASPVDKVRDWDLRVIDSNGHALKNVRVWYPHQLVPAGGR